MKRHSLKFVNCQKIFFLIIKKIYSLALVSLLSISLLIVFTIIIFNVNTRFALQKISQNDFTENEIQYLEKEFNFNSAKIIIDKIYKNSSPSVYYVVLKTSGGKKHVAYDSILTTLKIESDDFSFEKFENISDSAALDFPVGCPIYKYSKAEIYLKSGIYYIYIHKRTDEMEEISEFNKCLK
ncbi:hypothetical protein FACS189499_04060 [Clostridia bacterium]|nr:hypothetical protein FACS189499_04060 [Clostridia bacterium]